MADKVKKYDTTDDDDDDTGDDEQYEENAFRYIPLDESDVQTSEIQCSMANQLPVNDPHNGNAKPVAVSRNGYSSSGCESSDIEVIQESSDSIEVLESCLLDNIPYPSLPQQLQNMNVERLKEVEEADENSVHYANLDELKQSDQAQADNTSIQDSLSSDTPTIKSSSSTCSNSNMAAADDTRQFPPSPTQFLPNLEAEAREIFAAIDALDRERSNMSDSPSSSSVSPPQYDSPSHRPLVPLEPNIITYDDGIPGRPNSLSLPRPLQYYEKRRLMKKDSSASSLSEFSSRSSSMDALIEAATSTPLQSQGTVTTEGEMVAFVASGLEHMIRMSSPLSRRDSSCASYSGNLTPKSVTSMSSSASGWSTSSASGWSYSGLSRSPSVLTQSPEDIPPIDPRALMDLEVHAREVASSLDHMMDTLKKNLFKMSSITYSCLDAYKEGIDHTCEAVDTSIKSMYALMAKCEELSTRMRPIYQLHKEIQEINRLLDLFEAQMARQEKKT